MQIKQKFCPVQKDLWDFSHKWQSPSVTVDSTQVADFLSLITIALGKNKIFSHDTAQKWYSSHDPKPSVPADHKLLIWSRTVIRCNTKIVIQKGQHFGCKPFCKLEQIRQHSIAPDYKKAVSTKIEPILWRPINTFCNQLWSITIEQPILALPFVKPCLGCTTWRSKEWAALPKTTANWSLTGSSPVNTGKKNRSPKPFQTAVPVPAKQSNCSRLSQESPTHPKFPYSAGCFPKR